MAQSDTWATIVFLDGTELIINFESTSTNDVRAQLFSGNKFFGDGENFVNVDQIKKITIKRQRI